MVLSITLKIRFLHNPFDISKNGGNTILLKNKAFFNPMVEKNLLGQILLIVLKIVAYYITCHVPKHLSRMVLVKESTDTS